MYKLKAGVGLLVAALYAAPAMAMDDSQARLIELENRLKVLTESMGQQIKDLNSQVQNLQSQLLESQAKQEVATKKNEDLVRANIREVGGFKDGLILEDGGDWRLQINGGIQADYRHFSPDEQNTDTFSVRRAGITTSLYIFKDFTFQLGAEYANDNVAGNKATTALTNGYVEFARWPEAKIRVGQFRPLFTLEHTSNDNYLGYLERSLAYNLSSDLTFDRGIMLHGAPIKGTYYSVALTNGTGQNVDNLTSTDDAESDGLDTTARVRANFAEIFGIKDSVLHLGASYNQGTLAMRATAKANAGRTEGRGATFFSSDVFTGNDVDRKRWAVEAAVARGPVKLMAEYVNMNYQGKTEAPTWQSFDRDISAWYASAQWIVTGESYADTYSGGVFNRIRPKQNFDGKDGWGALELGLRYSRFDASDFKSAGCAAGSGCLGAGYTNQADAWTLAASWIFNPYVRVMANFIHTSFDDDIVVNNKSGDHEDALTMRAQFNF